MTLDVVDSIVHMKVKYHNDFGNPGFVLGDLRKARLI